MHSKLRDVSFNVHKGEIVGLAGPDGSGRTEVLENIFGVATRKSGVIRLHGKEVKNRRARDAIKTSSRCSPRSERHGHLWHFGHSGEYHHLQLEEI